ncbi:hypothetical protein WQ53_06355 [Pseudoxanthomonas suwonensis]|uniref:Exo-alpha-sialidase n=1 Tax=Pseudoxanthomonas suwonensis TaxID=314722 RepID=A0A0E3UPP6_9GAMM|nr:hypothetical protein WQ53_06355 [Pseudoxanthomonas suwonensis]
MAACSRGGDPGPASTPSAASGAPSSPAAAQIDEWILPAPAGAAQPDLAVAPDGRLLLSWIEALADGGHRLRLASTVPGGAAQAWGEPQTVAAGSDWFVNWADTPHVYALPDGSLWAHWLRSTGPSRMDYGIALVRSGDGGDTWSAPQPVHPGTRGDHGFVTFWAQADDRLGIAWLDSRQKAAATPGAAAHDGHHADGGPAMMLRAAVHGPQGAQEAEWPLDASTCDCCTTASASTDRGVVVVYRGRDAHEIRDTRLVRFDGAAWTAPRDVHADGWRFPGCPVNGPVVVADGSRVWVAWYTEADGVPELRAARSDDAGDRFGAPVTLAKGPQVLGRVALARGGEQLLAAWLEEAPPASQRLVLGRYDTDWAHGERIEVAGVSARGRASGLPRLQGSGDAAWLVWTDVHDGAPVLRGATVR